MVFLIQTLFYFIIQTLCKQRLSDKYSEISEIFDTWFLDANIHVYILLLQLDKNIQHKVLHKHTHILHILRDVSQAHFKQLPCPNVDLMSLSPK